MTKFVALRSKTCSYLIDDSSDLIDDGSED